MNLFLKGKSVIISWSLPALELHVQFSVAYNHFSITLKNSGFKSSWASVTTVATALCNYGSNFATPKHRQGTDASNDLIHMKQRQQFLKTAALRRVRLSDSPLMERSVYYINKRSFLGEKPWSLKYVNQVCVCGSEREREFVPVWALTQIILRKTLHFFKDSYTSVWSFVSRAEMQMSLFSIL